MTIADTIRSLKLGDRVRVTFEDRVLYVKANDGISDDYVVLASGVDFEIDDPAITSIEVIDRPLQVGDRVHWFFGDAQDYGVLLAIDEDKGWVKWDDGGRGTRDLSGLRRAS